MRMMFSHKLLVALLLTPMLIALALAQPVAVGDFSEVDLAGWEEKEFAGATRYEIVSKDGESVLKAVSENSASGLVKKIRIDVRKTPFINWRWRIENRLDIEDETVKAGDDYSARVYIVVDGGIFFWRTKAISYVWASSASKEDTWDNAFAGKNAQMVVVRDRRDMTSTWYSEKRNVHEDLKRLFESDIPFVDAVAIMTDTDNSHGRATAYYGDIYFTEK